MALESDLINRIRTIFLQDSSFVSIDDAAQLFGWSKRGIWQAINDGAVEVEYTCSGKMIAREELRSKAMELWAVETIEQALGAEARRILPPEVQTRSIRVRLPRYQISMLEYVAERQQTTVSSLVGCAIDDFAATHEERLREIIPGLSAAFEWVSPSDQHQGQPC